MNKDYKQFSKKNPEELQDYLHFKHRGGCAKTRKGKGSYSRKTKHRDNADE